MWKGAKRALSQFFASQFGIKVFITMTLTMTLQACIIAHLLHAAGIKIYPPLHPQYLTEPRHPLNTIILTYIS
jgi:hypothetical protein